MPYRTYYSGRRKPVQGALLRDKVASSSRDDPAPIYLPDDTPEPKPPAGVTDPVTKPPTVEEVARTPVPAGGADAPGKGTTTPGPPPGTPGSPGKGASGGGVPSPSPGAIGGGKGGVGNIPTSPMLPDPTVGLGFGDPNIRPVAGADPYQVWAAGNLPGMMGPTDLETAARIRLRNAWNEAHAPVTGAGLPGGPEGTNPTFEATRQAFEAMTIPQIRQQRTLMGLGDSNAVTNDIARAWAGVLPTLVENELGREERAIERGVGANFAGASGLAGLSQQQTGRELGVTDRAFGYGTGFRGIAEEANRAIYEDFLRRQGISERLLFSPLGQAGASIGQTQEVGGLFK